MSKRRAAQWRESAKPFYNLAGMVYSHDGLTGEPIATVEENVEGNAPDGEVAADSA